MAEQPEGEGDYEPVVYQTDDNQPRADYGDIDKGESIDNSVALDDVVDKAVQFIRDYSKLPDILMQVLDDMDTYLERRTMHQFSADPTTDFAVIEPIENLVTASVSYFNRLLESEEAQQAIDSLLRQYCQKVREVLSGCLQARLEFEDDFQVSHLIRDLRNVAKKVRAVIIGDENEFKQEVKGILVKTVHLRERLLVEELLVEIRKRVRVEIGLAELKDFLNDPLDIPVQVVIMVKVCPLLTPKPPADLERYREVLDHFREYKYTHEALSEMFEGETVSSSGMAELTLGEMTPEQKEEKSSSASDIGGAEGGVKSSRGPLSPPPAVRQEEPWKSHTAVINDLSPGTTEKHLFDLFKPFGTIRYVVVARDETLRCNGRGFVSFFSPDDVQKAIEGLSRRLVTMSKKLEPLEQRRNGTEVIVQELAPDFSVDDLTNKLSGYELERVTPLFTSRDQVYKHCYITFKNKEDAEKALTSLQDQGLFATLAKPRPR